MFKIIIFSVLFLLIIATPSAIIGEYQKGSPPQVNKDLSNISQQKTNMTKNLFHSINEFWQKQIVPFLKNIDQNMLNWWEERGKSFFLNIREKIIFFLEKEIFI